MKITKMKIVGTSGQNRRPSSGYAVFDDGKSYDWMILPTGEVSFFTHRRTHQGTASSLISFASPKRAEALLAAIS